MKFERVHAPGLDPRSARTAADDDGGEPITVRPPFDLEEFARESETRLRSQEESGLFGRPTAPPPPGLPVYGSRLGVDVVPALVVAREDLEWFDLTAEARRVLLYVDGRTRVTAISDKLRLPLDEVVEQIECLVSDGLVSWR